MRRAAALSALLVVVPVIALTGCGSSSGSSGKTATTSAFPTATGTFGTKPTLTFPAGNPVNKLQAKVLSQGNGPAIATGDVVAVNYLGQIWHGKAFDNSFDRHQLLVTNLDPQSGLIKGWLDGLTGVTQGSRLLLDIPPAEGYGSKGQSQIGVKGTDTLTFVIDVVGVYGKGAKGDIHATAKGKPPAGLRVTGALGKPATVHIAKGTPLPTKPRLIVLDRGTGAPIKAGTVVLQFAAVDWTGKQVKSTWTSGQPTSASVGNPQQKSALDPLIGVPVGSRVLLIAPAPKTANGKKLTPSQRKSASNAVLIDVAAQPEA